jgi:23S rRNA (uracil747-C5)-methyltransferase
MKCAYYESARCRSCSELPRPYADQLVAKDRHARLSLAGHAGAIWDEPVASPEQGFRNKAKMVVAGSIDTPTLGILDPGGTGVDLSDCPLYPPGLASSFAPLARFVTLARIAPYDVAARRGELKYLLITLSADSGELMLRFVLRSQEPLARIRKHLPELQAELPQLTVISANLQPEHKAVLEGDEEILLTPEAQLTMRLNGLPLHLRPRSFFQTNDHVAAALYARARDWVDEIEPAAIWDLFCGVGGFALHVADGRREVTGIEISAEAIASAEQSRAELGLARTRFRALDATDFALGESAVPNLVIVNPPRRGIGKALAHFLDASPARHVIYSSCNVDSLARDLVEMPGFILKRAGVFDMFPHTNHYEVLALLERPRGAPRRTL